MKPHAAIVSRNMLMIGVKFMFLALLFAQSCLALTAPTPATATFPPRHVCLMDSYEANRGPYMYALLDQLLERTTLETLNEANGPRIAICYSTEEQQELAEERRQQLQVDFSLSSPDTSLLLCLQKENPLTLESQLNNLNPHVIWMLGTTGVTNTFELRYNMRTSGLDRWIQYHCGPSSKAAKCCLYVGEGQAATTVASDNLNSAFALGCDPKGAPEPQFFGLNLLGPTRSVVFGSDDNSEKELLDSHPKTKDHSAEENMLVLPKDRVWVWSQTPNDIQTFVFWPAGRGTLEGYEAGALDPLPPLVDDQDDKLASLGLSQEGVFCHGEPSIDPSRQIQGGGDSEWMHG